MQRIWGLAFAITALACGQMSAAADEPKRITLVVQGGKLTTAPQRVKFERNDVVELTITSDRAEELHVHGYNLHLGLQPGKPATLKFTAKRTGRFSFELHPSGVELGVFEIYPRASK